jgi:hypothetical protein
VSAFARAVLLCSLCASAPAGAVECAPIAGGDPTLGRIDAEVRLRFLRDRMRLAARKARIWSWTWAGIYSSLTVGQLALLPTADKGDQVDNYIGAAASFIGLATIVVSPLRVMSDQRWLERRMRTPAADVCARLAEAEHLLVRDADSEAFGKSALVHAGNFVLNAGISLLLGLGFHHWGQAALQGLTGIAVGEAMIISQPDQSVTDLRRYRLGNLGLPPSWRPAQWPPPMLSVVPWSGAHTVGLGFAGAF